ncbi:MAG: 16S rRNA (cytidine(1402)-2'-O)-methyltransferase [Hyphomicrobiales bacterium]|nr:16S rRNA (cytidine(1402)-2'-O)-methyltransferase [Hyphomicrobiales bacterium]
MATTPATDAVMAKAIAAAFARLVAEPLGQGLYIVATPIGNLGDVSLRALSVLARADDVYCEDTRHSRKLLSAYGLGRRLMAYHDHSDDRSREAILARLAEGRTAALISDAGTPLVSDPGYKLARAAQERGIAVFAAPGPCAAVAALSISGLPSDAFHFAGFPPNRDAARRTALAALANIPATLILYEAANRLARTLSDMAEVFPGRDAAVARELTKLHEEVRRGPIADLAAEDWSAVKGEIVILVGPPPEQAAVSDDDLDARLWAALQRSTLRDAVEEVARGLGVQRKRVYDRAILLQRRGG